MAITITEQHKLFFKWTLLVWLNAAVSFVIAMEDHNRLADILGISCGVFTFVGIYTAIDAHLIKIQAINLRKSLFTTVLLKALTQFYPMIEMGTGILATAFIENIMLDKIPFVSTYLITLTDGLLLSIIVALFMLLAKFIVLTTRYFKQKKIQS